MVLALTATAEVVSGLPRVKLDVSGAVGSSIYLYRIETGATVPVRAATPLDGFVAPTGTAYDYEAPADEAVTYRVVDGASTADSGSVTSLSGDSPVLIHPGAPDTASVAISVLEWPTWTRPTETGVFQPIGRRLRVAVATLRQSVEGTLSLYTDSAADRDAMEALLADGSILLLRGTSREHAGSRWVSVGDVTEQPLEIDLREFVVWTLVLTEVDRPGSVDAAAPAATYGDADGTFATYTALLAACPTYADLSGGSWS